MHSCDLINRQAYLSGSAGACQRRTGSYGEMKGSVLTRARQQRTEHLCVLSGGTKILTASPVQSQCEPVFASRRYSVSRRMEKDRRRPRVQTSRSPGGAKEEEPHQGTYLLMKTKTIVWTIHRVGTGEVMTAQHELCTGSANSFEQPWQCEGEQHIVRWTGTGAGVQGRKGRWRHAGIRRICDFRTQSRA